MDFSKLDYTANADHGAVFVPLGPDGKPLDCEFDVIGADSGRIKKLLSQKKVDAVLAAKKAKEARGDGDLSDAELADAMKESELRKDAMELDVAIEVVRSWCGVFENGKEVPIEDKAKFLKKYNWLVPQIIAFVDDRANFMKAASKS